MLQESPAVFLTDWGQLVMIDGVDAGFGIFSDLGVNDGLGSVGMATSAPRLLMPDALVPVQLPGIAADQVVELPERLPTGRPFRYLVRDSQPDGLGWVSLILLEHPSQVA